MGLPRVRGRSRDYPDGRISSVFRWSTKRMGNRDVLGVLGCRPNSDEARKKEDKE